MWIHTDFRQKAQLVLDNCCSRYQKSYRNGWVLMCIVIAYTSSKAFLSVIWSYVEVFCSLGISKGFNSHIYVAFYHQLKSESHVRYIYLHLGKARIHQPSPTYKKEEFFFFELTRFSISQEQALKFRGRYRLSYRPFICLFIYFNFNNKKICILFFPR